MGKENTPYYRFPVPGRGREMMLRENDDHEVSEGTCCLSPQLPSAQAPLARAKPEAWKGTASRRGKLPALAFGQDSESTVHRPPYSSLKRPGENRKTFTETGTQNQDYIVF